MQETPTMLEKIMEHPAVVRTSLYARQAKSKRLLYAGISVCLAFILLLSTSSSAPDVSHFITENKALQAMRPWAFDAARDRENYALTAQQCDVAFPDLYRPITKFFEDLGRDVAYNDTVGNVHWGEGRMMVYDQKLYMLQNWKDGIADIRKTASLHSLNRALLAGSIMGIQFPNAEFSFSSQDSNADKSRPNWAYGRRVEDNLTMLVPEFGYYSDPNGGIGTWPQVQRKMQEAEADMPFEEKIDKLVWRGTPGFNRPVREGLVNVTAGKSWSDVEAGSGSNRLAIEDFCKYKYAAHTEGLSYSGRLKYLHNCETVILIHELAWETHDQHLLISSGPDQNYVKVARDWSDLDEKMDWLISHPADAARIARNNVKQFRDRYLTPAAEACYWRRLITEWGTHSFEPEFYEMKDGKRQWRGNPFENFGLKCLQEHM